MTSLLSGQTSLKRGQTSLRNGQTSISSLRKGGGGSIPIMAYQSVMDGGIPALWLDASDTSTISATGGLVDSITNKGTLGGSAASTGSNRPTTGINTINGLNVLDFSATHLDISSESWNLTNAPYTAFMVFRNDETGATQRYLLGGVASASFVFGYVVNQGGTANRFNAWVAGTSSSVQTVLTSNQGMLLPATRGQRSNQVTLGVAQGYGVINGAEPSGFNAARTNLALTALRLGGIPTGTGNRANGKFCELIIFPRILSIDEHQIIEGYLAAKWGMQASLTAGHPWITADPRSTARTYNFACWGDSFTQNSWLSGTERWPYLLGQLTGLAVYNGGVGGETSTQIRYRKLADDRYFDRTETIWAGTNGATAGSTVLDDITAMANDRSTGRFFLLPSINSGAEETGTAGYITKMANNAAVQAAFPNNYLDIRRMAVDLQKPDGPFPNASAVSKDIIQDSLRADGLHWTAPLIAYIPGWINTAVMSKRW